MRPPKTDQSEIMSIPTPPQRILVTGGAGYIGSHACLRLVETGHAVVGLDDFSRGHAGAFRAITAAADDLPGSFTSVEASIGDRRTCADILRAHKIDLVMHFAALAYVGESVEQPLRYYDNNTGGAISLLEAMMDAGVEKFVFSSTCATYGEPGAEQIPIAEDCPQAPINPYGNSKFMVEQILFDHAEACRLADRPFAFAALRYFNVAGSDPKTRIGEDHRPETHLIPICLEVAAGRREELMIFGDDYDTDDGTCIRDYVHVCDLIDAHIAVMNQLAPGDTHTLNVGLGHGWSVRQVLEACRAVTGKSIPESTSPRRAGDPPKLFANSSRIRDEFGWSPQFQDLEATVATAWAWMQANPSGYTDSEAC